MQRVAILYDASQAVLSTFELDEVLNQILEIVRDYFHLQSGAILLLDDEKQHLYIRSSFGDQGDTSAIRIPINCGVTGAAVRMRRPVYVPDVTKDARYIMASPVTRAELAIPLMVREEVVGVLDCQSNATNPFDSETIDLLTLFATQASIGLQNAKLYSLLQRRAGQLEGINAIAKQTTVEQDLKDLMERLCEQLNTSFGVDHVALFLRDEDGDMVLRAQQGTLAIRLREGDVLPAAPRQRRPARGETRASARSNGTPPCFEGAPGEVCLPLISRSQDIGMLVCGTGQQENFQLNDIQALESVADILATAVQNMRYVEKVKQLAYLDGLTGIFNRRYFEKQLVDEMNRAVRYGKIGSMLMIDLDHFKTVNDEFGHLLGDEVLRQISSIFSKHLRKVDVVCRYGGEEFAIILPETTAESALAVAEKLRRAASRLEVPGVPRSVTISAGVSEYPANGATRDELVAAADAALYAAKTAGRNCVRGTPLGTPTPKP